MQDMHPRLKRKTADHDSLESEKPVIELKDIKKIYKTGDEDTIALNSADLTIMPGEFVAIMGPSGSGKSTMLHILGLLDKPTSGVYKLNGKDVSKLSKRKQADIRNLQIGFIFQQFNLLPRTTVLDNLLLPTIYGDMPDRYKKAEMLLERVGLKDRAYNKSNQLSGGQIQRVAIARSLMMDPTLILADEPTGNLDSSRSEEIIKILQKINQEGSTIILITHEQSVADHAQRIIEVKDGKIVDDRRTK